MLKPQYLLGRLVALRHAFTTRIVLCLVDVDNCETALSEITKVTFAQGWTMMLVWSLEEAAKYVYFSCVVCPYQLKCVLLCWLV